MTITWAGRAYVDQKAISPEEYKMFFGKDENGILFDTANRILGRQYRDGATEVVPCDELDYDSRHEIKQSITEGRTSGMLERGGRALCWAWEPELTAEGEAVAVGDLPPEALAEIATRMLDDECRCGMVDVESLV